MDHPCAENQRSRPLTVKAFSSSADNSSNSRRHKITCPSFIEMVAKSIPRQKLPPKESFWQRISKLGWHLLSGGIIRQNYLYDKFIVNKWRFKEIKQVQKLATGLKQITELSDKPNQMLLQIVLLGEEYYNTVKDNPAYVGFIEKDLQDINVEKIMERIG